MANLMWALCCEQAIISAKSNNLTLVEIIEQFNVKVLPTVVPQICQLVLLWEKGEEFRDKEESIEFKILIKPKGELFNAEEEVGLIKETIPSDKDRFRYICAIQGIPLKQEGETDILILIKHDTAWVEAMKVPLQIKKV